MISNEFIVSPGFRTALLRRYIAEAFISLMERVNGEAAFIEDGERVALTHDKVAMNIFYHIEMPWMDEFGIDEGSCLATERLEKMLSPGFIGETLRLSVEGVTEMREVYRDIIFGAPDGELPPGFEFIPCDERERSQ